MSDRNPTSRRADNQRVRWPWRLTVSAALRAGGRERGTVLLMVVGVLALLAIIGVVYATIGQADRRSATTNVKTQRLNDQVEEIAAYLAKVIGDGATSEYVEIDGTPTHQPVLRTRGATIPWTDDHFISLNPANYASAQGMQGLPPLQVNITHSSFSPSGDDTKPWQNLAKRDLRESSDPYVATLEPEWLRFDTANPAGAGFNLFKLHDWRHISNFAPSGNFVNLANLRRNTTAYGGFGAGPGFQKGTTTTLPGMSYGLTLNNVTTGVSQAVGGRQLLPNGIQANPARPADWTNNQVYAFRPAVADGSTQPYQYEYVLNQWADADGDGFLDSRWFELTDLSGMFGPGGVSVARQVVPSRGRIRLFCAARCIDASSQINVNTAGDMVKGPWPPATYSYLPQGAPPANTEILTRDDAYPPGTSAADIAINRVLKLTDVNLALSRAGIAPGQLGYHGIPAPSNTAADRLTTDYTAYSDAASANIGQSAYDALRDARRRGPTALTPLGVVEATNARSRAREYDVFAADPHAARPSAAYGSQLSTQRVFRSPFDLSDQLELSAFFGVNDSETLSRLEATLGGGRGAGPTNHMSPLRDNRPRSLEMQGRDDLDANMLYNGVAVSGSQGAERMPTLTSVFTDVRHLLTAVSGGRAIKDGGVAPNGTDSKGASTDVSHALMVIQRYSQKSPPVHTAPETLEYGKAVRLIFKLYANALAPYTDSSRYPAMWTGATPSNAQEQSAYGLVYGGNPELALIMAAHMTANLVDAFDREYAMSYTSPAYMPPTGRPVTPDRNEPTAITLHLTREPQTAHDHTIGSYTPARDTTKAYNGGVTLGPDPSPVPLPATTWNPAIPPERLAPTTLGMRSTGQYTNQTGRTTIFGIEAQPFVTEFGTLALYTDTPSLGGGDTDTTPPIAPLAAVSGMTINMTPELRNSDFIGEVLAFQLNNPFDQDVALYDITTTNMTATTPGTPPARIDKVKFYIEYAGRYYCFCKQKRNLVDFEEATVTLKAGQTRVFYAVNPGTLEEMAKRLQHIDMGQTQSTRRVLPVGATLGAYTDYVEGWIGRQLDATGTNPPLQMTQIFPTTLDKVPGAPKASFVGGTQIDMDLFGQESRPPLQQVGTLGTGPGVEGRVAQLWRLVRSDSTLEPGRTGTNLDSNVPAPGVEQDNDPTNDLLADRIHDPTPEASNSSGWLWNVRSTRTGGGGTIGGANPGTDEQSPDPTVVGDNTGFSAIIWASIRRPSDSAHSFTNAAQPGGTLFPATTHPLRGVLPAWCMEARSDNFWTNNNGLSGPAPNSLTSFSYNMADASITPDAGALGNYTGSQPNERNVTLRGLLAMPAANDQISVVCQKKTKNVLMSASNRRQNHDPITARDYSQVAVEFHSVGEDDLGGRDANNRNTPPATVNNAIRRSRNPALFSRVGDFLLPLAIGPCFDPSRDGAALSQTWTTSSGPARDREAQWMTLSEAIALASGYYSPSDPRDPLHQFGVHAPAGAPIPKPARCDRGHLVLDAFTPYIQDATIAKQPLGSGVPFALGVIDQFRSAVGIASTTILTNIGNADSGVPERQTREFAIGGGTNNLDGPQDWVSLTLRQGLVNLNTAPLSVLRAVPLLSPEFDLGIAPAAQQSWVFNPGTEYTQNGNASGINIHPPPLEDLGRLTFDVAPTIKAYRDRSVEEYRQIPGSGTRATVDFSGSALDANSRSLNAQGDTAPTELRRDAHGFKSLGEVLLANLYTTHGPNPVLDMNSMTRFAQDESALTGGATPTNIVFGGATPRTAQRLSFWPQIVSSRFYNRKDNGIVESEGAYKGIPTAPVFALGGPELPNSYQDKLAIINALSNTASIRSDIFTVYFLIHGYTPEDVDVDDGQPLVPSVAKRYVMVVDRSNVVARGDKPRILMLKEVPIP